MKVENMMADFQYVGSHVEKLNFSNKFPSLSGEIKFTIDVSYEPKEVYLDEDKSLYYGDIILHIIVTGKGTENRTIKIVLDILGGFCGNQQMGEDKFKQMLSLNGCSVLYSISRSLIMSVSSQCIYNGNIVLPMINVFKLKEVK